MQNLDFERNIIGHMIASPTDQKIICRSLKPIDFTLKVHEDLFAEISNASQMGHLADVSYLTSKGFAESSLFEFVNSIPLVGHENNFSFWVTHLRELTILREISKNCSDALKSISDKSESEQVLNELTLANIEVRKLSLNISGRTNAEIIKGVHESIERAKNHDGISGKELFGIKDVDKTISGGEPGDLIIVAGRPGMGKSVLAVNIAIKAIKENQRFILWSLEMSSIGYAQRIIAALSGVNYPDLRAGNVDVKDLSFAESQFINSKIKIIEKTGVTIEQIYNTLLSEHEKEPIDFVCIDHLGLISGAGKLYERTTHNSNTSKVIAKELDVPLVMLQQLSRASENRSGLKEPQLSDLRNSGAVEEDADKVMFVHRPSYYDLDGPDQIIVAKNRGGKIGSIEVNFDFNKMLFTGKDDDMDAFGFMDDPLFLKTRNEPMF